MPSLTVHVFDARSGERRTYTFERSPVRFGRSPLNDLPLPFSTISHCHGVIQFSESGCSYVDLGSTNGSIHGGSALAQNVLHELPDDAVVTAGSVQLELELSKRAISGTRESYAFSERPPADQAAEARSDAMAGSIPPVDHSQTERASVVLDRLLRSFVELRRGRAQLLEQLGLGPIDSSCPLGEAARDPEQLKAFLLDEDQGDRPLDALARAYTDIMLHEVAFLSAVTAGARELLQGLAPTALTTQRSRLSGWLLPWRRGKTRWQMLERRRRELLEESALAAALFGKTFRHTYHSAFGAQVKTNQADFDRSGGPK